MIDLNKDTALPLYERLYRQLREEIAAGKRQGKLPSRRALADQLGISLNTVDAAYRQLESEGFLEARPRSGFYVQSIHYPATPAPYVETAPTPETKKTLTVDFAVGAVDEALFPMGQWQKLTRACLNRPGVLSRSAPYGDLGLRLAIAEYLARARGVHCLPEQVILGGGTDALLRLVGRVLPEETAFVLENPAYHRAYQDFSRLGHPVSPAQMDEKGIVPACLAELDRAAVYTAPSHQYPLGFAMPMGRRTELLAWCAGAPGRYLIEDDYDSEFRYDAKPLPSLQSIDRNGCVIYLGTMSGVVAPGLCISYLILPPTLLPRLEQEPYACNISTLSQYTLREFMANGEFERHLNRMRVCYRNRSRTLRRLLAPYGSLTIYGEQAGSYLAVSYEGQEALCQRAQAFGVGVYPIEPYFMGQVPPAYRNTVLLGFGNLQEADMIRGVRLLEQAWGLKKQE